MSSGASKNPMEKIVSDIFDNYTNMVTEATEDFRRQDKHQLRNDLNRAIAQVLDNYVVEHKPAKKIKVK